MRRPAWKSAVAGGALMLTMLGPVGSVHAQSTNPNGTAQNGTNQNNNKQNVNLSATPELDSVVLFGTGAISIGGYALLRLRGTRKSVKR
jgi:hypothetical protein